MVETNKKSTFIKAFLHFLKHKLNIIIYGILPNVLLIFAHIQLFQDIIISRTQLIRLHMS